MNLPRWSAIVLAAPFVLPLAVGCDAEDPTQGDEQNQTDAKWTTSLIAKGPEPFDVTGNERVTVATAKDGTLYVVYNDVDSHLALATRAPGAKDWKSEVVKADGKTGEMASIALDDDGTIHIVHYDRTKGGLGYATRRPGAAWTFELIGLGLAENRMERAPDGTLHVVALGWDQATATDSLVYAKRAGGKWTVEPIVANSRLTDLNLTLDDAGQPHTIVWQWTDETPEGGSLLLSDRTSGAWKTEPLGLPSSYSSELLIEGNVTHLAYAAPDGQKGMLYTTRTGNGAWSTPETVVSFGGWSPDLERDAKGNLHMVLVAEGRLRYAARGEDGKWSSSRIADGAGGHILPFFVPGKDDEIVYTDWAYRTFNTAKLTP